MAPVWYASTFNCTHKLFSKSSLPVHSYHLAAQRFNLQWNWIEWNFTNETSFELLLEHSNVFEQEVSTVILTLKCWNSATISLKQCIELLNFQNSCFEFYKEELTWTDSDSQGINILTTLCPNRKNKKVTEKKAVVSMWTNYLAYWFIQYSWMEFYFYNIITIISYVGLELQRFWN